MLREPPVSFYSIEEIERRRRKSGQAPYNKNVEYDNHDVVDVDDVDPDSDTDYEETPKDYPISTPVNKALNNLLKSEQNNEAIQKIIKIIQKQCLPHIKKLEELLMQNPTYLYITKIIGISKENGVRATGIIASFVLIYTINSILRRHKNVLIDIFTYGTPALAVAELLRNEPELIKYTQISHSNRKLFSRKASVRNEYTTCHQLKTWTIYLIISSLFNITDNLFINKSKPVLEPSVTQTVITTTPYLLRDTNKQVYTTIAQVTPFSQRFYNSFSQRIKNTIKYSWYWVLKSYIIYWMGYKDGREIIYNKVIIPGIRKFLDFQDKAKRAFSELDINFEDGDSFSKKYKYIPSSHRPIAAGNTRDQSLQPVFVLKNNGKSSNYHEGQFINSNDNNNNSNNNNNGDSSFYRFDDNKNIDGYYSDSFYESSEPINARLNNTNILGALKYSSNSNKIVQNTDSLSVEDPWKSNSFIGAPIKRNRSFSLNSINHSNNSLNNYRAAINDTNNKLSEYYNDINGDKDINYN